jgi:hypothetical protein
MFIVIASIVSLSLFVQLYRIKKCAKHDCYLYRFCALRREVMDYLRVNHDVILETEYESIKQLLTILNKTIDLYSKHKAATIFNFRKFVKYVSSTKDLADSSKKIVSYDNETINNFRKNLNRNIIKAFFAYTPFLFEEICLRIFSLIIAALIKIGLFKLNALRSRLSIVSANFDSIDSDRKQFVC